MKLAKVAIFLTGVMGMTVGGLVTLSTLRTSQEQHLIRTHETLKAQATLLVDQFYSILESTQKLNPKDSGESLPYVLSRGVVKLHQGSPEAFESFSSSDPSLEERVMTSLKSQLKIGDLLLTRMGLGTFEITENTGKIGIFVAIPVFKALQDGVEPETIEKVNLVLVDPIKAFPGLEKLISGNQVAYLLGRDGKVLAHSLSAYNGTDLKKVDGLKASIENLFFGAQTGGVQRYSQVDGTREIVAMVRAGVFPFAFAVEQKAPTPILSAEWMGEQMDSGAARKNLGVALVLFAIGLILFSMISSWATRGINAEIGKSRALREVREPSVSREQPILASTLSNATENFSRAHAAKSELNRENLGHAREISSDRNRVSDLLERIQKGATLEGVENELVSIANELTEAKVVYFRYQRRAQNLSVTSISDGVRLENDHLMQVYVRKDIELQVEQLSDSGKIASLTHYGPIKKIVQENFQGGSYEAWAVTSTPEVSLQAKMVGVLVLVDARNLHPSARPVLANVLKESGNYLFAQGNKLKSRASMSASTHARADGSLSPEIT